jgi:hypothetical protein
VTGLLQSVRDFLRSSLRDGFWFHRFVHLINIIHSRFSIVNRFDYWLSLGGRDYVRGGTELIQCVIVVLGVVWLGVVQLPLHPFLFSPLARLLGFVASLYVIAELFVFMLHWVFAANAPLHSKRRSLALFIANIPQLAVFFAIMFVLAGCRSDAIAWYDLLVEHLGALVKLDAIPFQRWSHCWWFAHFELLMGTMVLTIVIASLVGAIVRDERQPASAPQLPVEQAEDTNSD